MRTALRAALVAVLGFSAGCATPPPPEPPRESAAHAARRLDAALDDVLSFRDGLLREALDLGRMDREDRAEAARLAIASLSLVLDGFTGLDTDDDVDRDLARLVLDGAILDLTLARAKEQEVRHLAGPATALAFLAEPVPPSPATIGLFAGDVDGVYPAPQPLGEGAWRPPELRSAAARNKQCAHLLRVRGAQAQVLDSQRGKTARGVAEEAAKRADAYVGVLEKRAEEASKKYDGFGIPCGRAAFIAMLRTRHGVDVSPEDLVAFGETMLADTTRDLEALAASEFPGRTWRQALEEVRRDHAEPAAMPAEAFAAAAAARDFVIREGLVTIPEAARRAHIEMVDEEMAKSYPFAAYSFRLATAEGESGRYVVSPGATWMDAAQQEERLRGNCRAWTRVVAPHETWPGHHLQFWVADHTVSRIRREVTTPVFVEGWGLYCEGLLERHGFFPGAPERLARLVMRAWRASRVVIDVKVHCEQMTAKEAIDFLVEHAALPKDGATAEVRRYMNSPTQPFSYAWGCREIERLYADEQHRLGPAFDERAFHDKLLRCGAIPFRFVRRLFGDGGDAAVTSRAARR